LAFGQAPQHDPAAGADAAPDASDTGDLAASDGGVHGLALDAQERGELVDSEDVG